MRCCNWQRHIFRIVDTAGIRRPGRVTRSGQVEAVSVVLAKRAIEKADVAVLVIDSTEGATDQDATIAGEADKAGCGIIIAANKWDLMKGRGTDFSKEFDDKLRQQVKFLDYAPILHISALTGERAGKVLETIDERRRGAAEARPDRRAEPVPEGGDRGAPAGQPGQAPRADPLRRADQRRAADVRVLHQRRHRVSFLLRAVSGQPAARVVRPRRHADPGPGQEVLTRSPSPYRAT